MRGSPRRWMILAGIGAVLAVVLVVMLVNERAPQTLRYRMDLSERGTELRTVTIYYIDEGTLTLTPLPREVLAGRSRTRLVQDLVDELSMPASGYDAPLPAGTELLHYFEDGAGKAVLDFNERIETVHGSGIDEERLRLSALVRTVAENLGDIQSIQLLVLGRPLDHWGAHLTPGSEIEVSAW